MSQWLLLGLFGIATCVGRTLRSEGLGLTPSLDVNRFTSQVRWQSGCCDGEQVVVSISSNKESFRGMTSQGLLEATIAGTANRISIPTFDGHSRLYGPWCLDEGEHTITLESDKDEFLTFEVIDSFGILRAKKDVDGKVNATFEVAAPSRWCNSAISPQLEKQRAKKLMKAFKVKQNNPSMKSIDGTHWSGVDTNTCSSNPEDGMSCRQRRTYTSYPGQVSSSVIPDPSPAQPNYQAEKPSSTTQ